MQTAKRNPRGRVSSALAAIIPIVGLYLLGKPAALPLGESRKLAERFRFERVRLPEPAGPLKTVRRVHPSLRHAECVISFVGAAVALADLDRDGAPNDLVHVDPRDDLATVAPAPGTGERYARFTLDPAPLPFDPETAAPMGSLVGDYNEDGLPDILVYYWGRSPILFLGDITAKTSTLSRATFRPRELANPPEVWYVSAATQADLDGDGKLDLVLGAYFPDGSRILDAYGSGTESMPDSISRAHNGGRNRIFLAASDAPSGFREVPGVFDDEVAGGWTFASAAVDLDGDMLPEIYFVNDWGQDRLLHNRSTPGKPAFAKLEGERTFTTPRSKTIGGDSFNGMGLDLGDLNGDGLLDIMVNNITSSYAFFESHFVFLSTCQTDLMRRGIAPYVDKSERLGLARSVWAWEARLADFDNDGELEAMQAAGFLKGDVNRWPEFQELALVQDGLIKRPEVWPPLRPGDDISGSEINPFFVKGTDGRYHDVSREVGLGEPMRTRGIAIADVDGDGLLDFATANQWGPSYFFKNQSPNAGACLELDVRLPVGPDRVGGVTVATSSAKLGGPSRAAIGAFASVRLPDGRRLVGFSDGGTGHSGKRSPHIRFGLGSIDPATPVEVELRLRGRDGRVRSLVRSFPAGRHAVLVGDDVDSEEAAR